MIAIPLPGNVSISITQLCAQDINPKWGPCDAEVLKWDIFDFIDAVPYVIEILVQSDQNPLDITPCVRIYIFHSGDLLREFREVRGPAK